MLKRPKKKQTSSLCLVEPFDIKSILYNSDQLMKWSRQTRKHGKFLHKQLKCMEEMGAQLPNDDDDGDDASDNSAAMDAEQPAAKEQRPQPIQTQDDFAVVYQQQEPQQQAMYFVGGDDALVSARSLQPTARSECTIPTIKVLNSHESKNKYPIRKHIGKKTTENGGHNKLTSVSSSKYKKSSPYVSGGGSKSSRK